MRGHGGHRPIEGGQGVVSQEEAEARVVACSALLVEGPEAVEPERRPLAGAHADLEREDLGRELALLLEVAEQRPEVRDRVRDGLGAAGVRPPAGERLLEPPAGRGLPVGDPLPEEPVEPPDDAVPDGRPRLEGGRAVGGALRRVGDPVERLGERLAQGRRVDAAEVHGQLRQRQRSAGAVGGPADEDRLPEVGPVLDPVQVDAQARQETRLDGAVGDQSEQRPDDVGGPLGEEGLLRAARRDVIDVEDHLDSSVENPGRTVKVGPEDG